LRFASFTHGGAPGAGIVEGDVVQPFTGIAALVEYIALDPVVRREVRLGDPRPLTEVVLTAPVRPRRNVFCVGRNYRDHAAEIARAQGSDDLRLPDVPTFFTKAPSGMKTDTPCSAATLLFCLNTAIPHPLKPLMGLSFNQAEEGNITEVTFVYGGRSGEPFRGLALTNSTSLRLTG